MLQILPVIQQFIHMLYFTHLRILAVCYTFLLQILQSYMYITEFVLFMTRSFIHE